MRGTDDMLAGVFRARALAIVGDDDTVHALAQLPIDVAEILCFVVSGHGAGILEVEAQHLLMSADDTDLGRRRPGCVNQARIVNAACGKLIQQRPAMGIVADKARHTNIRPKERNVVRDVRRAAECLARAGHMRDRHRRLGRDARDLAGIVFIEHHIADDEDIAAHALFRNDRADFCHVHETAPILLPY